MLQIKHQWKWGFPIPIPVTAQAPMKIRRRVKEWNLSQTTRVTDQAPMKSRERVESAPRQLVLQLKLHWRKSQRRLESPPAPSPPLHNNSCCKSSTMEETVTGWRPKRGWGIFPGALLTGTWKNSSAKYCLDIKVQIMDSKGKTLT